MGRPEPRQRLLAASVDPAATYRVVGNVGGVARRAALARRRRHAPQPLRRVLGVHARGLHVDPDGSFECWISPDRHEHNWIESHPDRDVPRSAIPLRLGARPRPRSRSSASTRAGSFRSRRRRPDSRRHWIAPRRGSSDPSSIGARTSSERGRRCHATRCHRRRHHAAEHRRSRTAPDGGSSAPIRRWSSPPTFPTPTTGAGPRITAFGSIRETSRIVRPA